MKKTCMSYLIMDSRPYYGQSIFYMYTHIYKLKKVKLTELNEKEKKNSLNEVRILASIRNPYISIYKEVFLTEKTC